MIRFLISLENHGKRKKERGGGAEGTRLLRSDERTHDKEVFEGVLTRRGVRLSKKYWRIIKDS